MAEIITKDRKEYNIWDKVNGVWNRLNFLTNAKSVDADDGKDLQTKVGAIDGITSDLSGESETVAASIKCVNQLNSSLTDLSSSLVPDFNNESVIMSNANGVTQYTCTEDCFINFLINSGGPEINIGISITINDKNAFSLGGSSIFVTFPPCRCKKGDTIKVTSWGDTPLEWIVTKYGLH